MKEIVKWIVSFLLMLMCCNALTVMAEETPTFSVEKNTANLGNAVEIKINVKNNPGIASIKLKAEFDTDNLNLDSVEYNENIGGNFMQPQKYDSPVTLNWFNGLENSEGDWWFAKLIFSVPENAQVGEYPITISYEADNVYNISENNIFFKIENGSIEVKEKVSKEVSVTFDSNGGEFYAGENKTVILGEEYGVLPNVNREHYTFKGWYTERIDGLKISENSFVNNENAHTLYAQWEPIEYKVVLNTMGGSGIENTELKLTYEDTDVILPKPEKEGYVFDGWYDKEIEGTKIEFITHPTNDFTVFAYWIKENAIPEGLWVEDISKQIYTGVALKPRPVLHDGTTILVQGKDYTLSYKNNTKVGVAKIIFKGKGNYSKTIEAEFEILPKNICDKDISISCVDKVYNGKKQQSNPVIKWGKKTLNVNTDYTLVFSGDLIKPNEINVTIVGKGNYTGEKTVTYRITEKSISKVIVAAIPTQYYTGEELLEDIVLYADKVAQKAGTPLKLGVDYELIFENNCDVGKGKVTIIGCGIYGGSRVATFTIKQKSLVSEDISVNFAEDNNLQEVFNMTYSGNLLKPEIIVMDGEIILEEGKDYKVAYTNNKTVATTSSKKKPTVTITGKGNYGGTRKLYFNIIPRDLSLENDVLITVADAKYTKKALKPKVTIKHNGKTLKNGTDYKILYYANNVNLCEKDDVNAPYVCISGIKNYTGELIANFRIYKDEVSGFVVDAIASQDYTPHEVIEPEILVYANSKDKKAKNPLKKDVDYIVKGYINNKNAGTAKVIIEGIGYYGGTKTVSFKINKRNLSNVDVNLETTEYIYTGSAITPMIEVYDNEILLEKNVHYTVSYINNTNVTSGKKIPTIVVKGKGNYTGTLKEYFSILPKELDETLGITVSAKDVLFNAKTAKSKDGIVTSIIVKDGSKTLKNKTDYKVLGYLNSKECGEKTDIEPPTVVIEGLGNYTGMMEIPYRIYQASVSALAISKISSQPYTGKEIEPKPVITVKISKTDTITLTENVDYTLSWSNNVKIGKGKITITGIGNYGGTKTVTFTIVPKWLKWF